MTALILKDQQEWYQEFIVKENFRIFFQPIVDALQREVFSYEALSRCAEDAPNPFMTPFAIVPEDFHYELDKIALKKTISLLNKEKKDHNIFINFRMENIKDLEDLEISTKSKIKLFFEFEFFSRFIDITKLIENLNFLKKLELNYVIDDVGKIHTNPQIITLCAPSFIKLDRSLIINIHDSPEKQKNIKYFVNLIKDKSIKIIVEGVEKKEELDCLLELGIRYIQGFYFGKATAHFQSATEIYEKQKLS